MRINYIRIIKESKKAKIDRERDKKKLKERKLRKQNE